LSDTKVYEPSLELTDTQVYEPYIRALLAPWCPGRRRSGAGGGSGASSATARWSRAGRAACAPPATARFFFFLTRVTGPRRSLRLKLSDTRVYAPQIRARLGTTPHFCEVVVLKLRARCTSSHPGDNPGANRWFLQSTPIQMPPESGGICGRLT